MKKETALKRIKNAIDKLCPCESIDVKSYIEEVTYLFFKSLELDPYENANSTKNLKYSIDVNLNDLLPQLLCEAQVYCEKK